MRLSELLTADAFRYAGNSTWAGRIRALDVPGFRFTWAMRHCASAKGDVSRVAEFLSFRMLYSRCRIRYGFDIPYLTDVGAGLYLGHFGGVVVSGDAQLGRCVNLSQGVTIGRVSHGRKKGAPVLGDRVWVGPNAVVVGRITVGDDARIAPGAFVDFDVPATAVVVGNPARVVSIGKPNYAVNNIPDGLF